MKKITILALLISTSAISQNLREKVLHTSIDEVTVFLQGGLISRSGKVQVPEGKSVVRLKSLSPYIDEKSVQVKALGDFKVLSVKHRLNYLNELKKNAVIDSLNLLIESIEFQMSTHESRLQVLDEKQLLLDANKRLGGENSGASLVQMRQALDFYEKELTAIKSEEIKLILKIEELEEKRDRLLHEVSNVMLKEELPTGEIEIAIDSKGTTQGKFEVTYIVANVGWYPKYDVRVSSVDEPLSLNYKADVYQNTGVDWENVKLRLSNGNPNLSGLIPELKTWYINYNRNTIFNKSVYDDISQSVRNVSGRIVDESGEPIPGATILVKGTTIGTISDMDGNYSLTLPNGASRLSVAFIGYSPQELPINSSIMNVRLETDVVSLDEVVSVGYGLEDQLQGRVAGVLIRGNSSISKSGSAGKIKTTTVENQTTVEFEVDEPYSLKSNSDKLTVDLNIYEIETQYEYYAVPKLDKDAFLIARIVNWDQYNLLEGEANLYFEDTYVGRSILDAKSLEDTLNISLGRDKSIVISRRKVDEFTKKRIIGSNKTESRGFQISVRNKKSEDIKITLFDQIPVAAVNDIVVTPSELSSGKLNNQTGEVTWEFLIGAQEQKDMLMQYDVKYPKNERVSLE